MNKNNLVPFGFLGKPHGLRGNVSIRFFNKNSKLLKNEDKVFFEDHDGCFLTVKDINYNSKRNLVRFVECSSRNEIEKFSNEKFFINRKILPELKDDELAVFHPGDTIRIDGYFLDNSIDPAKVRLLF